MLLSNNDTCFIESNHWAELLCALWRAGHTKDEDLPGIKPLINLKEVDEFVSNCLNDKEISQLNDYLAQKGLFELLIYETTGDTRLNSSDDKVFEQYNKLRNNNTLDQKIKDEFAKWAENYPLNIDSLLETHNQSCYNDAQILSELVPEKLKIRVFPSIFMKPAPAGKLGCFQKDKGTLTFIFGYNEGYGVNSYLNWAQWYRMGVWHTILYTYWMERWGKIQDAEGVLNNIYEKLPEIYISKVSIHGFNVGFHRNLASFTVDNLVTVYKVLAEIDVVGGESGEQQIKWFYSLGRFLIYWFFDAVGAQKPSSIDLSVLVNNFKTEVDALTKNEPLFSGPLGGCENPIWNHNLRLVFSPSVSAMTRRILSIWFNQYWPVKPKMVDLDELANDSWDDHCNLVFTLSEDSRWLQERAPNYYLNHHTCVNAVESLQIPMTYVLRNESQPGKWSRICIADDEQGLVKVHHDIAHFSDWTSLDNDKKVIGRINYDKQGVQFEHYS